MKRQPKENGRTEKELELINKNTIQLQSIQIKIYKVRGQKIMLDFDLADPYEAETRALNQIVSRDIDIFL